VINEWQRARFFSPGLASYQKFFIMAANNILEKMIKKSTTQRFVSLSTSDNDIKSF